MQAGKTPGLQSRMKYIAAILAAFVVAIVILADMKALPRFLVVLYNYPFGDKVGHFFLFGLLNFIMVLTAVRSPHTRSPKRIAISTSLIIAVVMLLEEMSQIFFPNRTLSIFDLLAGYLGLALGGWLACRLRKRDRTPS